MNDADRDTRRAVKAAREAACRGDGLSHHDLVLVLLRYDALQEELTRLYRSEEWMLRNIERRLSC